MKENGFRITATEDGSHTLYDPIVGEHYHSLFGALNESMHVFIEAGFRHAIHKERTIRVLEIGLGTGLNLLLTYLESARQVQSVDYHALEAFPIETSLACQLNYPEILGEHVLCDIFDKIHQSPWGETVRLADDFTLTKLSMKLEEYRGEPDSVDVIYFDAFSPDVQQEMWTAEVFQAMARVAAGGCVLVTYSAKGQVRRNLQGAGFTVERLPGPRGKREMLRGVFL